MFSFYPFSPLLVVAPTRLDHRLDKLHPPHTFAHVGEIQHLGRGLLASPTRHHGKGEVAVNIRERFDEPLGVPRRRACILSGKSFIPMLIGSGCGVPGIMASRTIENDRDRKMTIMTTTFIPCGAKMPIIAMIGTALFSGAWWIAPLAYFAGVAAIICSGIILKKTKIFAGDPAPFVMELPAYHLPTVGNVLRSMWERGSSFIKKAGTIILLSSIVIWAGSVFGWDNGFGFHPDMELADSILGHIGNGIKWIFAPLGFGNASATIATIMGLVAKEEVVGVFGVLDFVELSKLAGISFMLFNLFCAPCFAALGAIKREMNSAKWFWITVAYQCVFAYLVSFVVYNIGGLFTGLGFTVATAIAILVVIGFVYLLVRPYKESSHLNAKVKLD